MLIEHNMQHTQHIQSNSFKLQVLGLRGRLGGGQDDPRTDEPMLKVTQPKRESCAPSPMWTRRKYTARTAILKSPHGKNRVMRTKPNCDRNRYAKEKKLTRQNGYNTNERGRSTNGTRKSHSYFLKTDGEPKPGHRSRRRLSGKLVDPQFYLDPQNTFRHSWRSKPLPRQHGQGKSELMNLTPE